MTNQSSKLFHIIINARPFEVNGPEITYRQVIDLAFPGQPTDILYSVHYVGPKKLEGTLVEGQKVQAENGMKFDVTRTNRS